MNFFTSERLRNFCDARMHDHGVHVARVRLLAGMRRVWHVVLLICGLALLVDAATFSRQATSLWWLEIVPAFCAGIAIARMRAVDSDRGAALYSAGRAIGAVDGVRESQRALREGHQAGAELN